MASSSKMIKLKSCDGEEFMVDAEAVSVQSQTIQCMIEDGCIDDRLPLAHVKGCILAKVVEFCGKHAESLSDDDLKAWDVEFVKVDHRLLFELIHLAYFLDIKKLLDLTCQTVVDIIKGKTPEEMRKLMNIKITPEEEEEIRRENSWAFDE